MDAPKYVTFSELLGILDQSTLHLDGEEAEWWNKHRLREPYAAVVGDWNQVSYVVAREHDNVVYFDDPEDEFGVAIIRDAETHRLVSPGLVGELSEAIRCILQLPRAEEGGPEKGEE